MYSKSPAHERNKTKTNNKYTRLTTSPHDLELEVRFAFTRAAKIPCMVARGAETLAGESRCKNH